MDSASMKLSILNHVNQLCNLSLIYKLIYPKIRQNPDLLNFEIISRLSDNKSCFAEQFQKPSGLKIISRRFVEKETVRDLFVGDSTFRINKFYELFDGHLLFIDSITNCEETFTRIDVIDSRTSKSIGSIQFNKKASHIQIVLDNQNTNQLNKLTQLNGFIYFSNTDSLFMYSFRNSSFILINCFDTEIKGLLLLNSSHLLVILRDCLFLLNLQSVHDHGKLLTEPTFRENNEIQFIESTIPKETVFNSQYLDGVDSISIIVGFKDSDLIKIYKFSNKNEQNLSLLCTIDSIRWTFYGYKSDVRAEISHTKVKYSIKYPILGEISRESILIDESFMIDNMEPTKLNRVVIKFALQHEGVTKIIEVNDKGEFNVVDEISENVFDIDDQERYKFYDFLNKKIHKAEVELDSFKNNIILFKLSCGRNGSIWTIHLYNIEKKLSTSKILIIGRKVNADLPHGLIVSQYEEIRKSRLTFYKINDDETINELSSVQTSYNPEYSNKLKGEMKIKSGKLLRIEPLQRLSIKEIDYLNDSKESNNNDLIRLHHDYSFRTMYQIDGRHTLIKEEKEEEGKESQFSIVEVNDQIIVKTEVMEGDYDIIGYKNGYLVLFNGKIRHLIVYKIENKQDSFEFKQIYEQHFNGYPECQFNELKPDRFIITLYDTRNDKLEVRFMEKNDENKLNVSSSIVSLNNIQLEHVWMRCLVTSLNEYLVLYQCEKRLYRLIYLINIPDNRIIDCIEMDQDIKSVKYIFNSNDLVVGCEKSVNYIKYDINSNKLNKIRIKDYQQALETIEIQDEYLFVKLKDSMEIYKIDDILKNNNELRGPIKLVKRVGYVQISTNKKYLIISTWDKELCVYKMDNFNQIASLYLNDLISDVCGIVSNEDYISFKLWKNSSLITFKINEKT